MVGSILKYVCPHNPNLDISESSFIFELCQNRNNSAAFLFPGQTACTAYILHTHWFWKFETSTRVTSVCLWLIRRVTTRVYVTCHDSRVTCHDTCSCHVSWLTCHVSYSPASRRAPGGGPASSSSSRRRRRPRPPRRARCWRRWRCRHRTSRRRHWYKIIIIIIIIIIVIIM